MLSEQVKEELRKNWGSKADAMDCYIEAKVIDESSDWACYIYSLDPDDDDSFDCIIDGLELEACVWSIKELENAYNKDGEPLILDPEFMPIRAFDLFKKLEAQR